MPKPRKCKYSQCGRFFYPQYSSLQICCSAKCALSYNSKKEVKQRFKEIKKDIKTHSDYLKVLQSIFNKFIRLRDNDKGCISCEKPFKGLFHAGHFQPTSSHPELRFNEDNVHGQCIACNTYKHGNIGNYADKLPKRIGWDRFEALYEVKRPEKKSISEILEQIKIYKNKVKELTIQNESKI